MGFAGISSGWASCARGSWGWARGVGAGAAVALAGAALGGCTGACAGGAAPGSSSLAPVPDAATVTEVRPRLPEGAVLVATVVEGELGPEGRSRLALYRRGRGAGLEGRVLGESRTWDLAELGGEPAVGEVLAVLQVQADEDPDGELVLLGEAEGAPPPRRPGRAPAAPRQAEAPVVRVLDWDGQAFVRLPAVEARLAGAGTPAAVRQRLR